MVLVLKYVSFTIKSSSLCFYLRCNGCALIIKLQESGKQKEINFWWNKYCTAILPPPHPHSCDRRNEIPFTISSNYNPEEVHLTHWKLYPTLHTPHSSSVRDYISWQHSSYHTGMAWLCREPSGMILPGAVWPFFSVCWIREQWTEEFPSLVWPLGLLDFLTRLAERSHHKIEEAGYHSPWQFSPFAERTHILTILHVCHWVLCTLSRQIRLLSVNTDENTKAQTWTFC